MNRISATARVTAWPIRSSRASCSIRDPVAGDLVRRQDEAQQPAGIDQADQHDVARVGDFVGQQHLAQARLDLALLADRRSPDSAGVEYPQPAAVDLAQHALRDQAFQRFFLVFAGIKRDKLDRAG